MLVIKQLSYIIFQESHFIPAKINDKIPTAQASEPMGRWVFCKKTFESLFLQ